MSEDHPDAALAIIERLLDDSRRPFTKREQATVNAFFGLIQILIDERRARLREELAEVEVEIKELKAKDTLLMWQEALIEYENGSHV